MNEGVIKFKINNWKKEIIEINENILLEIENIRHKLFNLKLIGFNKELNLGYGNISVRLNNNNFLISGSQTGHLEYLNKEQYSIITNIDFKTNSVDCYGIIKPSSESITHGAFYYNNFQINSVIHIHNLEFWNTLIKNNYPSIPENIEYGSVELSDYIINNIVKNINKLPDIYVLKGHIEGIFVIGADINDTYNYLMNIYTYFFYK